MWNCGVSRKMSALRPIFLSLVLASGGYGFPSGNLLSSFPAESSSPDAIATSFSLSNRIVELNLTAEQSDASTSALGVQSGPHRPLQLRHQQHDSPAPLAASASRIVPLAAPVSSSATFELTHTSIKDQCEMASTDHDVQLDPHGHGQLGHLSQSSPYAMAAYDLRIMPLAAPRPSSATVTIAIGMTNMTKADLAPDRLARSTSKSS